MPHLCFSSFVRLPSLPLAILASLLFVPPFAFANETDQEMPVSAVGGAVHADLFTGTATYAYSGGYHHIGEREFLGFHDAKVTDARGNRDSETTTYTADANGQASGLRRLAAAPVSVTNSAARPGRGPRHRVRIHNAGPATDPSHPRHASARKDQT